MSSAPLTNASVMMPMPGVPTRSALMASCKLHEEQLPQSPRPANMTAQSAEALISSASAGAE